ncbi:Peptide methionine sulfoxide reductase MsrB (Peptide-methionine (R)-S-oxide reductase) [Durusdinium trenchii]|uniref:Peptide-methionine (R)-S-oxide reductase n=1 Tax=Durusdinium trenchii TaxID=1381693 RepID=A0ABP0PJE6_9DINO
MNSFAESPWRKNLYNIACLLFMAATLIVMSLSAGGWDITGSKGTHMRSELCDHKRDIPDGRTLFQQVCAAGGTERAFSGVHDRVDESNTSGTYRCACCGEPLFPAVAKFHSGSGWPSFTAPVANALGYRKDILQFGSTEVHCAACGAHLGHVFDDGPPATGLRFCINSVCLWRDDGSSSVATDQIPWILNAYLVLLVLFGFCASCCVLTKSAVIAAYPYYVKKRGQHNSGG